MTDEPYRQILDRVGWVLLIVGVADTARIIFSIAMDVSVSGQGPFLVLAGIFLKRGSLSAATIVNLWQCLYITAIPFMSVAAMLDTPFSLQRTYFYLHPYQQSVGIAITAGVWCLAVWTVKELSKREVIDAKREVGKRTISDWIPMVLGALIVGITITWSNLGDRVMKDHAVALAKQKLGQQGYQYYVDSLSVTTNGGMTSAEATVSAWNDNEIREVPVEWKERK
jgi:hypothetical protein